MNTQKREAQNTILTKTKNYTKNTGLRGEGKQMACSETCRDYVFFQQLNNKWNPMKKKYSIDDRKKSNRTKWMKVKERLERRHTQNNNKKKTGKG